MGFKRRVQPTDKEWATLGDAWWSRWGYAPMPGSAVYAQAANDLPGFLYENVSQWGGVVRFGQDLRERWLYRPRLGSFRLHRLRHAERHRWSLYPWHEALPVVVEHTNRFVQSLTPEAYEAVVGAAGVLLSSGRLVPVDNAALEPDDPDRFGFELDGVLLPRFVAEPRVVHDAEWKTTKRLVAELNERLAYEAKTRYREEDPRRPCLCGCGETVLVLEFKQGHWLRHKAALFRRAELGEIAAARELLGRGWCSIERYRELVINPQLFNRKKG